MIDIDTQLIGPEHPLRRELHNELHARPSLYFDGDIDVWHLAIVDGETAPAVPERLQQLAAASKTGDGRHGIADFEGGRIKWELHTEFLTLTYTTAASDACSPPPPFGRLREEFVGQTITAVRVIVRNGKDGVFEQKTRATFVASEVGGGDAEVHSDFRLNEAGFLELHLFNRNLNAYRTGRMVRRLLEIETYRMMALLAMPTAKETIEKLAAFDNRLELIIGHMQSTSKVDKALLGEVTKLSSEVLNFSARARNRFGATKAYSELVASRLLELREGRVSQRQRIGTFIDRRFQPAVRSFFAAERRLDELGERVSLAGDLLRTTVQVQLEDQNASLLSSVEERTRAQVQLQQAVEGFSVLAITYYGIGLLKVCLESLQAVGMDIHYIKPALLGLVPVTLFAVWRTVRHVRSSITSRLHLSEASRGYDSAPTMTQNRT